MQYGFSAGDLYAIPTGNNPTPTRFGTLQGVSIDFSFNLKELYGRNQFPVAIGRGAGKINGKADYAAINARAFSDIFFGGSTPAAGATRTAPGEAHTIASNAATATNGANFISDLGVSRSSDGVPFVRVASAPTALEYSVNTTTGVYTFNASHDGDGVLLSYTYADPAGAGQKVVITNQAMGAAPSFKAVFTEEFDGKQLTIILESAKAAKLSLAPKLEDFTIPSFDFMAAAAADGTVLTIATDE